MVGQSVPRRDAWAKVTGAERFTADVLPPRTLFACTVPSPEAHAEILSIDTASARALFGVRAVLTWEDVPAVRFSTAGQTPPIPSPWDTPILSRHLRYAGEPMALIAADTVEAAREAAGRIRFELRPLPPIWTPAEAAAAPPLHEPDAPHVGQMVDPSRNLAAHVTLREGEAGAAEGRTRHRLRHTVRVGPVSHAALEPHATLAIPDGEGGLVIVSSTQIPHLLPRMLGEVLGLPPSRIRVRQAAVGGGFGGKQEMLTEPAAALLALRTGRPILYRMSREEVFRQTRTRHGATLTVELEATGDGDLISVAMEAEVSQGAYGPHAASVTAAMGRKALPLYRAQSHAFEGRAYYTTLPPAGAFRGYGAPQGYFALESAMNRLAAEMGIDPLVLRERNVIRPGDAIPFSGQRLQGAGPEPLFAAGREWAKGRPRGKDRGLGFALAMQGSGVPGQELATATVRLQEDGTLLLYTAASEMGQGSRTVLPQILASVLEIDCGRIRHLSGDTDLPAYDVGAFGSSTVYVCGNAVQKAGEAFRQMLLERCATILGTTALHYDRGEIRAEDGRILTLADLGQRTHYGPHRGPLYVTRSAAPSLSPPPFFLQGVDLSVDRRTGEITIHEILNVVECGTVIHPQLALGQVEGAVCQALGYALTEQMHFRSGHLLNASFADYKIPTALDVPPMMTRLLPGFEPSGPLGAKSIGEVPVNGAVPATAAAIHQAVGIWLTEPPFTPEKVWRALESGSL